jgi:hypothetical protein
MSRLWMSIEPESDATRLMLTLAPTGTALRARLPTPPAQPHALRLLLEAVAAWYGAPLCAVLDVDAQDVRLHPERWVHLLGDLDDERVRVEWVAGHADAARQRDRFLEAVGDFGSSRRLITLAATGLK